MGARIIIGYFLLIISLIGIIYTDALLIAIFSSPPTGGGFAGLIAGLGIGILLLVNLGLGAIFLFPGSYLVKVHDSVVRVIFGFIILLVSILPPILLVMSNADALALALLIGTFPLASAVMVLSRRGVYGLTALLLLILIGIYINLIFI